ncbi:DUF6443 domain-containing protein [Flavobacterium tructae]|uniref:DUF6443 domain-containing protein n=1 Tax=Flavobacterium tructae TaxID=1114873 RepID=UPI0035A8DC1D
MIKKVLNKITFLLVFINVNVFAQTPVSIIKPEAPSTDYIVTGEQTLIVAQSIVLKPTTWIKAGSTFAAKVNSNSYIPSTFSNENYVFTRSYQKGVRSLSEITNNDEVIENISYFDGLGRPMQSVAIKASPGKVDLITPIEYDAVGRQDKEYLPYLGTVGTSASYRTTASTNTNNYYISNYPSEISNTNPNPFSQKKFEESPLNRVLLQAAPGKDWALGTGHEEKFDYQTNGVNEVKLFTALTTWNAAFGIYDITLGNAPGNVFYRAGELNKTVIKNENWKSGNENTTEEFKDNEGRIILKRTYGVSIVNNIAISTPHDIYYVYDIYGNLTYVLTPKADKSVTADVLRDVCYQYKYDHLNRMVEKKMPGKEWEFIVYDKLDRPILTQDGNLKALNKWIFTKYDAFDRPVYTGEYLNSLQTTRAAVQGLANGTVLFENRAPTAISIAGTNIYYSNVCFPTSGIDLLTISYYDHYSNIDLDGATAVSSFGVTPSATAKGFVTTSKVRIVGTSLWTTNVNYYDSKGRGIYNYSKNNFLSTISTTKSKLDFTGRVLETISTYKKGTNVEIVIANAFTFDHMGRVLTQKQKINNQAQETIVSNTYNNLGQLKEKIVGGVQTVNYKYNIRGWLKNINDINNIGANLFAFQINYNDAADPLKRLYNGNISQTFWKTAHTDKSLRSYSYTYDALNRLTEAADNLGRYNENSSYDKNGNMMKLFRNGNTVLNTPNYGTIDNLVYTYDGGNRLLKVEDGSANKEGFNNGNSGASIDYNYDVNGNMITDANKGISTPIGYNYLGLPTLITLPGGTIGYTYDATGLKQRKVAGGITTDYAGGFQYENNNLQFFPHQEGYVRHNNGVYEYIYQYKDHLGNIRLSYNKSLSIIEENNYYPFGLEQKSHTNVVNTLGNSAAQKFKFNGKELQGELGLNFYDYGARNYDPALGRWMNIDLLAEKSRRFNPYTYALNNPVFFIDPDGMIAGPTDWVRDGSNWIFRSDITSPQQAKDAGYSDYSDGKTNNTYTNGDSTITLKEGGKWSSSSNDTQKTAPDRAEGRTEIAAVKVGGSIAIDTESIDTKTIGDTADAVGVAMGAQEITMKMADQLEFTPAANKLLKGTEILGKAAGVASAFSSTIEAYNNPTTANILKASVNTGMLFVRANPIVGLTLGIMDVTGVSDKIYDGLGNSIDSAILTH